MRWFLSLARLLLCSSAVFLIGPVPVHSIDVYFQQDLVVKIPPTQYDSIATKKIEIQGKRFKAIPLADLLAYAHVRGERVRLRGKSRWVLLSSDVANDPGLFVYFTRTGTAKLYASTAPLQVISFPDRLERIDVLLETNYFSAGWLITWAALLGGLLGLLRYRTNPLAQTGLVFLAVFFVYASVHVPDNGNTSDNYWYVPTSLSVLRQGNLELNEYSKMLEQHESGTRWIHGNYYLLFPVGTPLLTIPFVQAATFVYADVPSEQAQMYRIAALSAKWTAALSVALLFVLMLRMTDNLRQSLFFSALFAFATSHFGLHAGGLWSHNAVLPLLLATLLFLTARNEKIRWLAALPLAMAYVTRPTYAVHILLISGYMLAFERRSFVRFALLGIAVVILFILFSLRIYGHFLPPYYSQGRILFGNFFQALAANVISPNRGLFIFTPIFLGSAYGMYRAFRYRAEVAPLFRLFSIMVILHWLIVSTSRNWWAGATVGPRYFCDVLPLLILLLLPAWEGARQKSSRIRGAMYGVFGLFLLWSLFVQYRTVTSMELIRWNSLPTGIKQNPGRVWDWKDMQILRISSPARSDTNPEPDEGEDP